MRATLTAALAQRPAVGPHQELGLSRLIAARARGAQNASKEGEVYGHTFCWGYTGWIRSEMRDPTS